MEVILIKDVDNLGKTGDVVKVKDGYARNRLLPQKLAFYYYNNSFIYEFSKNR